MTSYARKLIWKRSHPVEFRAARARERKAARVRSLAWITDYKSKHPCACGETDPICLDFHHRNPADKKFPLCNDRGFSLARIKAEVAKCEVICSNDHRRGHAGRPRPEHAAFFPPAAPLP